MTFVQYRGHAIISDVYKDSPLAGWVFPSDILIAIDEVPVSGTNRVSSIFKQTYLFILDQNVLTFLETIDIAAITNVLL